jgi:hypothetical protein
MKIKKRRIVLFVFSIGIPIAIVLTIWFAASFNDFMVGLRSSSVDRDYAEIRDSLYKFKNNHGRWPKDFEESGCLDVNKKVVTDFRTGVPYLYLADKNVYFYIRGSKELCPVFVMLPKSYRTNFWPFGKQQNIVMFSYPKSLSLQTLCVDPKDIIELKPGQRVVEDEN